MIRKSSPHFGKLGNEKSEDGCTVFDGDGNLPDQKLREQLGTFLDGFAAFAESSRGR